VGAAFELEQEVDGRWIAEMVEDPRVLTYGWTPEEAIAKAQKIAEANAD
jgi:predicted RNase H-like HicB family nuclease